MLQMILSPVKFQVVIYSL